MRDNNEPGTIENYERYAKTIIKKFGDLKLRMIGRKEVDDFYGELKRDGLTEWKTKISTATANRIISFLRATFYMAMKRGVSDRNPVARIEFKDEENERQRVMTRAEEVRLMEHADEWLKPILKTAVMSGLRLGELTGLQWADSTDFKAHKLDLEGGVINIGHGSKSGKRRRVPIPPELHEILSKLERWTGPDGKTSPYVFPHPVKGEKLHKRKVQSAFEKARKAAKIWDLHFHDLRRTFASRLYEGINGDRVSLGTIAELLGHDSTYVTERYTWLSDEHLRKAMGQTAKVARFPQDGGNDGKATG